ncbi:ribokinase [Mariniphaga anaerophila]|uniref:Ribokinase n=1 Tax=Mariniphaga anaerophila TaxID=1484053 RepID=A0A1M5FCJ1_9BACT|nr:ribokinase [Mariniphaga anaerophila]SHF89303.1 ribokinase [Mariniphaga anaerophila]
MKKPKIVIVGSSNTDMVIKVPRIPIPGETIIGKNFMMIPGGKGANQAVAAARAGADVTFITCVADDAFGRQAIENYRKEGINTSYIKVVKGEHSGIALIAVANDGENSIAVAPGANNLLLPEDIEQFEDAFSEAQLILAQLEIPIQTVLSVAEIASAKNIPFVLNPAPAMPVPVDLLKKVTLITPNESEAGILTAQENLTGNNIQKMAGSLREMGAKTVLVTLGEKGVYLKNEKHQGMLVGYPAKAVDTTAAGDIFNGTLVLALADGKEIKEAIDFAQRAAAISVTRIGAQPSAPTRQEIDCFI